MYLVLMLWEMSILLSASRLVLAVGYDVFGIDVVGDEYFIMRISFGVGYRIWCIW